MSGTGVTAARGFRAAGITAGLKPSGRPDLAVVVNDGPRSDAAGVFTANRVVAAPVRWCRQLLGGPDTPLGGVRGGDLVAVVLNSGGANACTGPDGFADTVATAERLGAELGVPAERIAVASTGLIGERLPMDRLLPGLATAVAALGPDGGADAATAIMTTDTVAKTAAVSLGGWTVGGMAKGAGMLAPGLATMLVVITTDAEIGSADLDVALREATRTTFDRLDSDGAMSTNDTVLVLASGASGVRPDPARFAGALTRVCAELARQLLADAEGATKEIAIEVRHAVTEDQAVTVGRAVARNSLVKTAFFGQDPNWGRILAAVGAVPVEQAEFDADQVDVAVNDVWICRAGAASGIDRTTVDLTGRQVSVTIDLHAGTETATVLTNDLSHAYVHENSAYST